MKRKIINLNALVLSEVYFVNVLKHISISMASELTKMD